MLFKLNLPPLETRRDIAMLGILHRAALRLPPRHFWQWVAEDRRLLRRSERHTHNTFRPLLEVPDANRTRLSRHSLFGMIKVYNLLPNCVVRRNRRGFPIWSYGFIAGIRC